MRVLIMAGGLGTRLRPVIGDSVPKPMVDVNGRPFLEWLLLLLRERGFREFVISVGYRREAIMGRLGDGSSLGVRIEYSVEEEPLGTGGALRRAMPLLRGEDFLLVNGDTYVDVEVRDLVEFHESRRALATIGLVEVSSPVKGGFVDLGADGMIRAFREGVGTGLMNAGIMVLGQGIRGFLPGAERFSLEADLLPSLAGRGLLSGVILRGRIIDIGTPEGYALAREVIGR
ncbi:nucleotidyltransferase family protein [Conexivisphaera calida]|uniref:Nucleotidyl transferase possibly involved in threonylcarbamoyladenosine formation n=1 Tax=Conexivisphaera calida TaxID=1874277 RepID=A0A4P2VPD8_9ARCH|nr:sugar phosphate nucleotidyltransferase [Conexivisphaera calida]BBE42778.1 Nucleotidyl transferase possibly involved in threonylcarbamoyladenosine formation [Conexivisphaera calida]